MPVWTGEVVRPMQDAVVCDLCSYKKPNLSFTHFVSTHVRPSLFLYTKIEHYQATKIEHYQATKIEHYQATKKKHYQATNIYQETILIYSQTMHTTHTQFY